MKTPFEQWLAVKSSVASYSSIHFYRRQMKTFWFHVGSRPVSGIDHAIVAEWLKNQRESGLSPNTMRKQLEILRSFFSWCRTTGLIDHDPMNGLPKVHKAAIHKVPFTWEQYQSVLRAVEGRIERHGIPTWWTHACTVAWHTGLRMSDVALLQWDQLDFISDIIHASPKKLAYLRQRIVIPIEPELRVHLLSLDMDNGTPWVHPVFRHHYLARQTELCDAFREICDSLGLHRHSYHSFRHGFVSRLLNAGADVSVVASITGQSYQTIRGYAHISIDAQRNALDRARHEQGRIANTAA